MGSELLSKMLPAVEKMSWPENPATSETGHKAYEIALDQADSFKGNPKDLLKALKILQNSDSRPWAMAGVAYTVLTAAAEKNGSYAPEGLEATMSYLEAAQEDAPDEVDINFIEALVYIYGQEFENARLVLDYLHDQDPHNYYLMVAEGEYWRAMEDLEEMIVWFDAAEAEATTTPQKVRLTSRIADAYMSAGQLDKAEEAYKKAIYFDKSNPELWHRLSVVYWKQENYEEADRWNERVVKAKANIPAAYKLENALKQKLNKGGLRGKLFGR